jgi:hypothetical protein
MEYGVMYIKIVSGYEKLSWIQYCMIFNALPKELQYGIKRITDRINKRYKIDMVIPLSYTAHNGCVVNSEQVEKIATDLYYGYHDMLSKISDRLSVRLVYSIGEIENVNVGTIHEIGNDDVMVRVGTFLDKYNLPGIYKV